MVNTLPDVMTKLKVIAKTQPIPNDTVSVRKGLDPSVVSAVRDGMLEVSKTADGQNLLKGLYNINGLATAQDSEAVLFSFDDAPIQKPFSLYRRQVLLEGNGRQASL